MRRISTLTALAITAALLVAPAASSAGATEATASSLVTGVGWGQDSDGQATATGSTVAGPVEIVRGEIPDGAVIGGVSSDGDGGHTCTLVAGAVYCWGPNTFGQLGVGADHSDRPAPVAVDTSGALQGRTVTQIATTSSSTCVLTSDGVVACWGAGGYGQLGTGATAASDQPVQIVQSNALAGKTITSITGGGDFFCALDSVGQAYCWGYNREGQLGDGTEINRSEPVAVDQSALGAATFTSIEAGGTHTCGITDASTVFCWGSNFFGQGGIGRTSAENLLAPTAVVDTHTVITAQVQELSLGTFHTCLLLANGRAACWGDNGQGQLGDGSFDNWAERVSSPVAVVTAPAFDNATTPITSISAGFGTTCATAGGRAYCWGYNQYESLGVQISGNQASPLAVVDHPTGVNGSVLSDISAHMYGACALSADARVFCWGANADGQAGIGTMAHTDRPSPVYSGSLADGEVFTNIQSGDSFACGLTNQAAVYCWGDGQAHGELGDGALDSQSAPRRVNGLREGTSITRLAVGSTHACAVDSLNHVYCWGDGTDGALGDGLSTSSPAPVEVTLGTAAGRVISSISAGRRTTCMVVGTNAYCWGLGTSGQIGDGTNASAPRPVRVASTAAFASIAVGGEQVCALSGAGVAYCWGLDSAGSLGRGVSGNASMPKPVSITQMPPGTRWSSIDVGSDHACGVSAGKAYCWGTNTTGQLGDGTASPAVRPQPVDTTGVLSGKTLARVSSGAGFSCALDVDGLAYCWGSNANGQLGHGSTDLTSTPVAATSSASGLVADRYATLEAGSTGATVHAVLDTRPSAAVRPSASARTGGRAKLTWEAPGYDGMLPISGYVMEAALSKDGPWTTPSACATVATTSCTASGLSSRAHYFFRVAATNGLSTGPWSTFELLRVVSIQITAKRMKVDPKMVTVAGVATGLYGQRVTVVVVKGDRKVVSRFEPVPLNGAFNEVVKAAPGTSVFVRIGAARSKAVNV